MPRAPNVPRAPGVPALLRDASTVIDKVVLLVADIVILLGLNQAPWGIYDQDGFLALRPDSFGSLSYLQDNQLPDYPIEQGSFGTYNKVATPARAKVAMFKGGSDLERAFFLNDVADIADDLDLYSIVMPDGTIPSVNVEHFDLERKEHSGVGLLTVEIWFTEIRVAGASSFEPADLTGAGPAVGSGFQDTREPAGANPVSVGTMQPQQPAGNVSALSQLFT